MRKQFKQHKLNDAHTAHTHTQKYNWNLQKKKRIKKDGNTTDRKTQHHKDWNCQRRDSDIVSLWY